MSDEKQRWELAYFTPDGSVSKALDVWADGEAAAEAMEGLYMRKDSGAFAMWIGNTVIRLPASIADEYIIVFQPVENDPGAGGDEG